ncbi:MAG: immunoglobulin domain-containing protein, partial [Limisphaerales bacterium]
MRKPASIVGLLAISLFIPVIGLHFFQRAHRIESPPSKLSQEPVTSPPLVQEPPKASRHAAPRGNILTAQSPIAADPVTESAFAKFDTWAAKFSSATSSGRAALEVEGIALAKERRDAMKEMIQKDPERALALAVRYEQRLSLPSGVVDQFEQQVNGTGDIHVGYACAPERAETILTANVGGKSYEAYTRGRYFAGSSGNVTVNGVAVDGALAISKNPVRVLEPQEAASKYPNVDQGLCAVCKRPVTSDSGTVVEAGSNATLICSTTETVQLSQNILSQEFTIKPLSIKSGVNRVLIIWAKFSDASGSPTDLQTIKDNFTVNVSRFYKDNSYGACSVAPFGDAVYPATYIEVQTGHTKDYYHFYNGATGGSSAGRTQLRKDALNAAIDAGYNLGDYDLRAIVFSLIDNISANDPWYFWGLTDNISTIADSESTLFNGKHNVNLIAHEQGHDFGLSHAGDWISATSDPLDTASTTVKKTYGDTFDVMGMGFLTTDANYTGHEHYNARHKNKLGWISGDGVAGHTTDWVNVDHNMTNRLYAMDNSKARGNNRALAMKVHRYAADGTSKRTDYWLQYRQLFTASKYNIDNGIQILFQGSPMINDGGGDADTTIIDMNPGTGAVYPNKAFDVDPDLNDCSLIVGKTLSDTEGSYQIHITPVLRGQTILGDGTALPWLDVVVNTNVSSGNSAPSGSFDMNNTDVSGTTGQLLDLVVNSSDPDNDKMAYYWEFSENNGTTWPINYDNISSNWVTHAFGSTGTKAVRCRISDMKGHIKLVTLSGTIQISTTVPAPNLTTSPVSQTVVSGTDVTFTSQADLTTGVKYQWTYNGSGTTVIGTDKNYTRPNVQVGQDDGTYTIKVSNSQGSDSASATLTVQDPVGAVTISPGDTTKVAGDSITMSANVNPAGTSQKYHWYKSGALLSGKTESSLSFTSLAATDAGTYKCIVTNNVSTNEGSMILAVTVGITVTGPTPLNVTNNVGSNVTFTVTASGGTGLQYHWYYNDTTLIPWATAASMTLTNIQMTDDGFYKCVVTNTTATNTSDTAYLKVYWPVAITGDLVSRTNNVGDNASFNVTATGTNLTYTWYSNSTVIANQTSSNLNLTVDTNLLGVSYKVVIGCSDSFYATNTATSAVATVSVPYSAWIKLVQWNFNSATPDGNVSTGTTNNSYSLTAPAGINTNYSALKSNYLAGSTSDPASTGTDNSAYGYTNGWPTVTGANRTNGIEFRVSTLGYTNVVVTWEQRNSAQASKYWRLIYMTNGLAGATNAATVHTNLVTNQFTFFSSDLSGKAGVNNNTNLVIRIASEWESTAIGGGTAGFVGTQGGTYATNGTAHFDMVGIWGKPQGITITGQPLSVTKAVGDNQTFTVTATGLNPQYQWRSNTVAIASATTSALTLNNVQLNYAASYDCKVTNVINAVTSSVAVLTVLTPPAINVQPQSQTNYTTLASVFTVSATGGGTLTYQWKKNGISISDGGPVSGSTTTSLTVANLQTTDAGNYTVVVANGAGSTTSTSAVLTVNLLPSDWYWSSDQVSQGGSGNWSTANVNWGFSPSGPYSYIWQNTNIVSAHFGGTGGTVTATNGITVNRIYFESSGYWINGTSNLTFAGANAGADIPGANNSSTTN